MRLAGSFGSTRSLSSSLGAAQPLLVTDLSRRNRHEHGSTAALVSTHCINQRSKIYTSSENYL